MLKDDLLGKNRNYGLRCFSLFDMLHLKKKNCTKKVTHFFLSKGSVDLNLTGLSL